MNTLDFLLKRFNTENNGEFPFNLPFRRDELAKTLRDLGYKVGAEIGVDRGIYSEELCQANPELKLFCIDPWKDYDDYDDIKGQQEFEVRYNEAVNRLKPYNCTIIRKSSMSACKDFEPESLDFVYLDGNHSSKYLIDDLDKWSKIVKKGGIIAGHDYRSTLSSHGKWSVTRGVHNYLNSNNIKELFLFIERRDSSWMFVNK